MLKRPFSRKQKAVLAAGLVVVVLLMKFLTAMQTQANVPAVKADLRSVANALSAYAADHAAFPVMRPFEPEAGFSGLNTIEPGHANLRGLTTPVAYLQALYNDRLYRRKAFSTGNPHPYWTDGREFLVWSSGPDGDYDIKSLPMLRNNPALEYDVTNGTFSSGDIIWTGKLDEFPEGK